MSNISYQMVSGQQPKTGNSVDISSGLGLPRYDHVDISATSSTIDHYVFKMKGITVAVLDLTYQDSAHATLTTVDRAA